MSNYGAMILSKVVDNNAVADLTALGLSEDKFTSTPDREAFKFIKRYASQNDGQAPSYAAVLEEVPDFIYIPDVTDSYAHMKKQMLNDAAYIETSEFVNEDGMVKLFAEHGDNMPALYAALEAQVKEWKQKYDPAEKVGTDLGDPDWFLDEYRRRKNGESAKTWRSRYAAVGNYTAGNMYVIYGESGRGKSVTSVADCVELARQGATVLIWSMEMAKFEVGVRIYSIVSADDGVMEISFEGIDMDGGFNANDMREGKLSDEEESKMEAFLRGFNDSIPGKIILRATDDKDFHDRSLAALEAEITKTGADVVLVDPFYYLDYERNRDGTTGGAAAQTSKQLRKMAGTMDIVILAITQSDVEKTARNAALEGPRELSLPSRSEVKKTAQLMQDAAQTIAVDTDYKQGRGIVGINKGRDGGEGDYSEITYLPQYGIVKPLTIQDELIGHVLAMGRSDT